VEVVRMCEHGVVSPGACNVCLGARVAELEAANARLIGESKRWRAMFEHAAHLIAEEIDAYGLCGDEATEEIERWAALAAKEG